MRYICDSTLCVRIIARSQLFFAVFFHTLIKIPYTKKLIKTSISILIEAPIIYLTTCTATNLAIFKPTKTQLLSTHDEFYYMRDRSEASTVKGVGGKHDEQHKNDGGNKGYDHGARDVVAVLVKYTAYLPPPNVRIALLPNIGDGKGCTGCRCHHPSH